MPMLERKKRPLLKIVRSGVYRQVSDSPLVLCLGLLRGFENRLIWLVDTGRTVYIGALGRVSGLFFSLDSLDVVMLIVIFDNQTFLYAEFH